MKKHPLAEVIAAGILWGTSALFVAKLSPLGITSLQMTFVRALVAFIFLLGYGIARDKKIFKITRTEALLYIGSGVSFFGTAACYFAAMQKTSVSTAVVLMYTAPIFVMLYSVLFLGERLTGKKLVSLITMLIGCCFVSGIIGGFKFDLLGILTGFMSGLFYSAYNIFAKIMMRKKINPVKATCYCFFAATIIGMAISKPDLLFNIVLNDVKVLPVLILLGICTCILPYVLYNMALRKIPAGTASSLAIVEPMAATIFGVTFLSQKPDLYSVIGITLILFAVFLLSRVEEE